MHAWKGRSGLVAAAVCLWAAPVHAERHGLEQAQMLERGDCEAELILDRLDGGSRAAELELTCRVGPVELGGQVEQQRTRPGSETGWSAEMKWSRRAGDWHLGVFVVADWQAHQHPHYAATSVVGLASYPLRDDLQLHLNLGRQFERGAEDNARSGVGLEWTVHPGWTLMAERYARDATQFARGTVRWDAGRTWSLQLGRVLRIAGPEPSRWVLGVVLDLDDD